MEYNNGNLPKCQAVSRKIFDFLQIDKRGDAKVIIAYMESLDRKAIISQRLRTLREEHNYSKTEVAAGTGIDLSMVSRHESGDRVPGRTMLEKYANFYNESLDYISGRSERTATTTRRVPIIGAAPCGIPMLAEQNIEGYIELPGDIAPGSDLAAIRIKGDSMEGAHLHDGQLAIIKIQEYVADGEIALVCIGECREEATVKRIKYADSYLTLTPVPAEGREKEFEPLSLHPSKVRIIGKVSGVWWG